MEEIPFSVTRKSLADLQSGPEFTIFQRIDWFSRKDEGQEEEAFFELTVLVLKTMNIMRLLRAERSNGNEIHSALNAPILTILDVLSGLESNRFVSVNELIGVAELARKS